MEGHYRCVYDIVTAKGAHYVVYGKPQTHYKTLGEFLESNGKDLHRTVLVLEDWGTGGADLKNLLVFNQYNIDTIGVHLEEW